MVMYQHRYIDNSLIDLPVGKVVCVGRNYAEHAKELNNPLPTSPVLFIKPKTAIVAMGNFFSIPLDRGECHFEIEMAVLIGETIKSVSPQEARAATVGYGIGLDLTLRELQSELKTKGHPWEIAKAFDGSCPLSGFVEAKALRDPNKVDLVLKINGETRQFANSSQMIFPVFELVAAISKIFTLEAGDVVLTGTPAGVGALAQGDQLVATLGNLVQLETTVY